MAIAFESRCYSEGNSLRHELGCSPNTLMKSHRSCSFILIQWYERNRVFSGPNFDMNAAVDEFELIALPYTRMSTRDLVFKC
jgi:hypothetical protein